MWRNVEEIDAALGALITRRDSSFTVHMGNEELWATDESGCPARNHHPPVQVIVDVGIPCHSWLSISTMSGSICKGRRLFGIQMSGGDGASLGEGLTHPQAQGFALTVCFIVSRSLFLPYVEGFLSHFVEFQRPALVWKSTSDVVGVAPDRFWRIFKRKGLR